MAPQSMEVSSRRCFLEFSSQFSLLVKFYEYSTVERISSQISNVQFLKEARLGIES